MDVDSQLFTYMPTYPEQVLGECSLVRIHPEKLLERVRNYRLLSFAKICHALGHVWSSSWAILSFPNQSLT